MRHRLLGLEHAPRDDLADRGVRHARVARRREHRLRAGAAAPRAAPARLPEQRRRGARLGRFDVGLDDAAVRAAALDAREIEALVCCDALGERRREDARAARCRGAAAAPERLQARPWARPEPVRRQALQRLRALRPQAPRPAPPRPWALRVSPSSSRTAMTALTFTPSAPSGTTIWPILPSSTASTSMVALSVSISADHLAGLDGVAFLDMPLGELALGHGGRQRGHQDVDRHGLALPRQRLQTSRAASTMFSGCGSASFSRLAA